MPTHSSPGKRPGQDRAVKPSALERVLQSGLLQLNEVERALAMSPEHSHELRRRLCQAHAACLDEDIATTDIETDLWSRAHETWREAHAPLIAARRVLSDAGVADDQQAVAILRSAVEEHLARAQLLGEEDPWAVPDLDNQEDGRCASGMHVRDARVATFLDKLGMEGSALRTVGVQAAEEVRQKARERWASWECSSDTIRVRPPWARWRNRTLFPFILARVLWHGEVRDRVARLRKKPPGTIYAVFRSITRVSSSQLELGIDDRGRQTIVRRDPRRGVTATVADLPALSEEIFAQGLTLLGSHYTLPLVEWLVERAHAQTLAGADRPDLLEIEGGWEALARVVLEKPAPHPEERSNLRTLAQILARTSIRWQDGARSSSLFMLYEDAAAAGRGRGRSVVRFTLDARLLAHEHHRARERFGPGAGPAQWADWRIVPLPRPRVIPPLPGSPRNTYGPQTVALRLLWLFFTRHGDQLLYAPGLIEVTAQDLREMADEAELPARFSDPLLVHLVRQRAIIAVNAARYAPADPAARAFIADGWRRSRSASQTGKRSAQDRTATTPQ